MKRPWTCSGAVALAALLLLSGAGRAAGAPTAAGTAKGKTDEENLPDKESRRVQAVMEWARRTKPSHTEFIRKLNEPVIAGNRHDLERNLKLAQAARERSDAADRAGRGDEADRWQRLSRAFSMLAEQNRTIAEGFESKGGQGVSEAFARLLEIEESIFTVTGRRVKRDWSLPGERAGRQQNSAAAPAVRPAPSTP